MRRLLRRRGRERNRQTWRREYTASAHPNERPAGDPAGGFQNQQDCESAQDPALGRQDAEAVGDRRVHHHDEAAGDEACDEAKPIVRRDMSAGFVAATLHAQKYPGHAEREEESEELFLEESNIEINVNFAGPGRRHESEQDDDSSLHRMRRAGQGAKLSRRVKIVAHRFLRIGQFQLFQSFQWFQSLKGDSDFQRCSLRSSQASRLRIEGEQTLLDFVHFCGPGVFFLVELHGRRVIGHGRVGGDRALARPLLERRSAAERACRYCPRSLSETHGPLRWSALCGRRGTCRRPARRCRR